jgi:hypothetical protein
MTVAALRSGLFANRWSLLLVALVAMLIAAVALIQGRPAEAQVTVTRAIAPARAAALVEATAGDETVAVKAIGDEAKLINASMPFDAAPVHSLRPFDLGGDGLDQRRALLCLTQAVYYEAGFEPLTGRRAVAQVVLNRMRHPAYPKSVCGVVYQKNSTPVCQFSFVCDGSLFRQPSLKAWRESHDIAAAALAGYVEQSVGSATHYHADYVAPRWAPMLSKVAKLGAHIFYRWPGSWGLPAAFTGRYIGEPSDPSALRPAPRPATLDAVGEAVTANAAPVTGPSVARAPNDVGGLLDTSKGWTLNIPMPSDAGSASRAIAKQQSVAPPATVAAAPTGSAPALASR